MANLKPGVPWTQRGDFLGTVAQKLQAPLSVHTLRLFTHLKEYLHFFDFHFPFPQLFLPGALGVLVGVSGRSVFVPLSILTASSCVQ